MVTYLGVLLGAYIIGSLPFSVWMGLAYGVDIRQIGSGNPGATNVVRNVGWGPGIVAFLLDVAKGSAPALAAKYLADQQGFGFVPGMLPQDHALYAGLMAIVGHTLSPFLKFKGGKGVATGLGALLGTAWLAGVIGFGMFLVLLAFTRYVSVSSVVGATSAAVAALVLGLSPAVSVAYVLVAVYIIVKHRANFERLRKGEEPKIGKKAAPPT